MKCSNCGFENKDKAKFCTKCGGSLTQVEQPGTTQKSSSSKYIIIALVVVIIVLAGVIGYFALNNNSDNAQVNDNAQGTASQDAESVDSSSENAEEPAATTPTSSAPSTTTNSKEWVLIGTYSGSGTDLQDINVPAGTIKVEFSAYPIKNYATNHLYVSGSNGMSGGVDWGSTSAVETRSDSFTYTSSSPEVFTIDAYETVSWEVNFYSYE